MQALIDILISLFSSPMLPGDGKSEGDPGGG